MKKSKGLRRSHDKPHIGGDSHGDGTWIFSYADMITILMIFFIMMLSISNISAEKFSELKEAMRQDGQVSDSVSAKSVKVSEELLRMARKDSPTLAGVPLEALAKKAAESGGDRVTQITAGVRILLDTINKDFIERDLAQAAEFERLKAEMQRLSKSTKTRTETKGRSNDIIIKVPTRDLLNSDGTLNSDGLVFVNSLVSRVRTLVKRPSIRIETHSAGWSANKGWRSDEDALERTTFQAARLAKATIDAGADPTLISLAAYGNKKPLATERDVRGQPLSRAAELNERIVFVVERRALAAESAFHNGSGVPETDGDNP